MMREQQQMMENMNQMMEAKNSNKPSATSLFSGSNHLSSELSPKANTATQAKSTTKPDNKYGSPTATTSQVRNVLQQTWYKRLSQLANLDIPIMGDPNIHQQGQGLILKHFSWKMLFFKYEKTQNSWFKQIWYK